MSKQTPWFQQQLESIWYQNKSGLLFYLLLPLSALFRTLSKRRRIKLESQQITSPIPIIVVGNINIGGTGKTPLVLKLTELLLSNDYKPVIITRGYKGTSEQWPLEVKPDTETHLAGDEAKLMAIRSQVPVIAGADRLASIQWITDNTPCNIIISDDGLQHYKMPRDIEIVVIDAQRRFGNGHCLPAGPLREETNRLTECDFLITNGRPNLTDESLMLVSGTHLVHLKTENKQRIDEFNSIQVVTGIGNPQRFIKTLKNAGMDIIEQHFFPDHYHFTALDFDHDNQTPIVMTEKDAVKCTHLNLNNAWYLPVEATLEQAFEKNFLTKVADLFNPRK